MMAKGSNGRDAIGKDSGETQANVVEELRPSYPYHALAVPSGIRVEAYLTCDLELWRRYLGGISTATSPLFVSTWTADKPLPTEHVLVSIPAHIDGTHQGRLCVDDQSTAQLHNACRYWVEACISTRYPSQYAELESIALPWPLHDITSAILLEEDTESWFVHSISLPTIETLSVKTAVDASSGSTPLSNSLCPLHIIHLPPIHLFVPSLPLRNPPGRVVNTHKGVNHHLGTAILTARSTLKWTMTERVHLRTTNQLRIRPGKESVDRC